MSQVYIYNIPATFTGLQASYIANADLISQINTASIGATAQIIETDCTAQECRITMSAPITSADLEAVCAAHTGLLWKTHEGVALSHEMPHHAVSASGSWEDVSGAVANPNLICDVLANTRFKVLFAYKTDGAGGMITINENNGASTIDLLSSAHVMPDTAGAWKPGFFITDVPLRNPTNGWDSNIYTILADRASVTTVQIKHVTATIIEISNPAS